MTNIPYRFRETAFRRYERVIANIVSTFPFASSYDPSRIDLSSTTFACRLRDAMRSLNDYHWETSQVDLDKFEEIFPRIIVAERHGKVVCGQADMVKEHSGQDVANVAQSDAAEPLEIQLHEANMPLALLGILAHNRVLTRPIRVLGMTEDSALWLAANFDVVAHFDGEAVTIL